MKRPTIADDRYQLHAHNLERNVRFQTNSHDRDRGNSKNRRIKPNTNGMLYSHIPASSSIFQIKFPETDCHAKTRLPDQRL